MNKILILLTFVSFQAQAIINPQYIGSNPKSPHVQITLTDLNTTRICSGTLIDKHTIRTAAHCVQGLLVYGMKIKFEDGLVKNLFADSVAISRLWDGDVTHGHDIANITLTANSTNTRATIYPMVGTEAPPVGAMASFWGYGCTSLSLTGAGWDRIGSTRIVQNDGVVFVGDGLNGFSAMCPGDSGGPVYYNGKLIGVNSFLVMDAGAAQVTGFSIYNPLEF